MKTNLKLRYFFFFFSLYIIQPKAYSININDTIPINHDSLKSLINFKKKILNKFDFKNHSPNNAIILSAILPGLGQAYNRDYWKVPIAAGIVAIPVSIFFYNNTIYNQLNFALNARAQFPDSTQFFKIPASLNSIKNSTYLLTINRNNFRENRTVALFWIFITWGLNIAEAAVAGHLKNFSVSKDLSLDFTPKIQPNYYGATLTLHWKYK